MSDKQIADAEAKLGNEEGEDSTNSQTMKPTNGEDQTGESDGLASSSD